MVRNAEHNATSTLDTYGDQGGDPQPPPCRQSLIQQVRTMIDLDRYETPVKLDQAVRNILKGPRSTA